MTQPSSLHVSKLLLLTACSLTFTTPAQQPAPPLTFEVATIKPHGQGGGWRLQPSADGYTGTNISLLKLVGEAYGIFDPKLITGGQPWIDKDKFDLEAKFGGATIPDAKNLTYRRRADMLRPLLADRFHLRVHFETKYFPVYNLVLAEGGPKLTETKPENISNGSAGQPTCLHRRHDENFNSILVGCRTIDLEELLQYETGRTVIDKTGLSGRYDIKLRFSPENTAADSPLAGRPTIFKAVQQQLGLKLEPATAPLDTLIIDSADKPSEN